MPTGNDGMNTWRTLTRNALALLALAGGTVLAQTFSSKPITFVVPWPAGGPADLAARAVANELQTALGQATIVLNPAGAGGSIGTTKALAAPADGHTIIVSSQQELIMAPMVYKSAAYTPEDARAVALLGHTALMLVARKDLPAASMAEFAALMKASPKLLSYCTPGLGTLYPVVVEKMSALAQAKALHVPYPAMGQCLNDIAGGSVDFAVVPVAGPFPGYVDNGSIKAIALLSNTPSARLPKLPPVTATKGFESLTTSFWVGFHVSAKTPDAVVEVLNKAICAALAKPEVRGPIEAAGATIFPPMAPKQANDYYLKDAHEIEVLAMGMGFAKQ